MVEPSHTAGLWPSLFEPLRTVGHKIADWFAPASEAESDQDGYQIDLELPGVSKDDIEIAQHENVLIVKGEKRATRERKDGSVYFCERQYGAFQRSFRLPPDADGAAVAAVLRDGVLSLTIPRIAPQTLTARKIPISI